MRFFYTAVCLRERQCTAAKIPFVAADVMLGVSAAMAFIIPLSTMIYATVGGLKATFTTSYMHTVIIFVVCTLFMFQVYVPNNIFGGIDDVSAPFAHPPTLCKYLIEGFLGACPNYRARQIHSPLRYCIDIEDCWYSSHAVRNAFCSAGNNDFACCAGI